MAGYPQDTIKLVFGGNLGGDIWRSSVDMGAVLTGSVVPNGSDMNAIATAMAAPVGTLWAAIKTHNLAGCSLDYITAYYFQSGFSKAVSQGAVAVTHNPATATVNQLPFRTALVCSKRTSFAGRKNMGRAYLPFTSGVIDNNTGQALLSDCNAYATAYRDFLVALRGLTLSANKVASQTPIVTSSTASSPGQSITNIIVDTLVDSQRRRTNKDQATARATAALP